MHTLDYRTLFDQFQLLIRMAGPNAKCFYFNNTWLAFTGRAMEQEVGDGWMAGVHADDLLRFREVYRTAFARRESFDVEYRLHHQDGSYHWIVENCCPMYAENGEFCGYVGSCHDVTEKRVLNDMLLESERCLREMLDHAKVVAVRLDLDGNICYLNRHFLDESGWRWAEVAGRNWFDLFVPEEFPMARQIFASAVAGGEILQCYENEIFTRSGDRRLVSWSNAKVRGPNGAVEGISSVGIDLTDQVRAKVELEAYRERLTHLTARISLVEEQERRRIAGQLHDQIGQNLALVRIKLRTIVCPSGNHEHIATIAAVREVLDRTISQVRTLTAQISPVVLYELGLSPALARLVEELQTDYGTTIYLDASPPVEQIPEPIAVTIFQVARELLLNALKHARAKNIRLQLSQIDRHLKLTVYDNGIGFDPESTLNPLNRERGFGLFNVMQKVEHLHGSIDFTKGGVAGMKVQIIIPLPSSRAEGEHDD